jgi:hypothetical protein
MNNAGEEKFLLEGNQTTIVERFFGSLYKIRINCGNPCSGTTYLDLASGEKAGPFPDVIAEDPAHHLVAYMQRKGVALDCMLPCKTKPVQFDLPLSPVAAPILALDTAFFKDRGLVVHYSTGKNFDPAIDTLESPIKSRQMGNK